MSTLAKDPRREFALDVVKRLRNAGFEALWAGGCVRDSVLGFTPTDYDVATSAHPDAVMGLFPKTVPVGVSFGVVRVRGSQAAGEVEVATFRSDGAYLDGRHPESVTFSTAEKDASRRDFTINGMFLDPLTNSVIDYVGGQSDLKTGTLRAIGDPVARFSEDKLRLIRAVRFASRFDLTIESRTREALVAMAPEIVTVAPERIAQELKRILVHPTRSRGIALAFAVGIVAAILPDLVPMKGLKQDKPVQPDGDLWDHTLLVLEHLPANPSFTLAFAALLHDVGKPRTKGLQDGRVTFYHHEQVGRHIADGISRDLRLSNAERERVGWLVEHHQYLGEAKSLREAKLKRMLSMPGIDELLTLHRADALASTGDTSQVEYCEWYLQTLPRGPLNPPPLATGRDLIQLGLEPGPKFAALLDQAYEAQLEGRIKSKSEALAWVRATVDSGGPAQPEQ
jgi:poly(A) polymerase